VITSAEEQVTIMKGFGCTGKGKRAGCRPDEWYRYADGGRKKQDTWISKRSSSREQLDGEKTAT
jgi:hypothetical protein